MRFTGLAEVALEERWGDRCGTEPGPRRLRLVLVVRQRPGLLLRRSEAGFSADTPELPGYGLEEL